MTGPRAHDAPGAAHPAQRRTLVTLSVTQALGGIGNGVALGVGSLLVEQVTGREELAGLAATLLTLGGALLAVPLARLARRSGRRPALATGAAIALGGSLMLTVGGTLASPAIVLAGFLALGAAMAVNLQSRFAATDLAEPRHRARDLSLVVWMTTIGVVVGPNLIPLGDAIGGAVGLPHLVGAYLLTAVAQALTLVVLLVALRPDPLLEAAVATADTDAHAATPAPRTRLLEHRRAVLAIAVVASSHATMVGIMALTPVHLEHAGHDLASIGLTMSAHTAGMYALSPVFGILADRLGRLPVILAGQSLFVGAVLANVALPHDAAPLALALLGLGWSAATVAGSALVTESVVPALRPFVQGRSDLALGLTGAAAGAVAGPVLGVVGYAGLSIAMSAFIVTAAIAAIAASRAAAIQSPSSVTGS